MPSASRRPSPRISTALAATAIAGGVLLSGVADASSSRSVKLTEFKVSPAKKSVGHGKVTFVVKNAGDAEHELVVIKTRTKAAELKVKNGKASEKGSVGEVELGANKTKRLALNLKKGHYALICNFKGHYTAGMHADLTVK